MSQDVESFLCDYLQTIFAFLSSAGRVNLYLEMNLFIGPCSFYYGSEHHEENALCKNLTTDTKGESIFNVLKEYFIENSIFLSNIISVATDGAPVMVGRYRLND
ncbi:SCAN domain-containing protein 3 [Trichonephila clavipes]|nr:SCAN domain-containing protein 3 [Trichonephila clavipes]